MLNVYAKCDTPGCNEFIDLGSSDSTALRRAQIAAGWTAGKYEERYGRRSRAKDYCPECTAKRNEKAQTRKAAQNGIRT